MCVCVCVSRVAYLEQPVGKRRANEVVGLLWGLLRDASQEVVQPPGGVQKARVVELRHQIHVVSVYPILADQAG